VDGKRDGSTAATLELDGAKFAVTGLNIAQYPGVKGELLVKNSKLTVKDNFRICFDGKDPKKPTVGKMVVSGKSSKVIVTGNFYMNDGGNGVMKSYLTLKKGCITVEGKMYVNDDAKSGSSATILIKGGKLQVKQEIDAPFITDGTAEITIEGGELIAEGALCLGKHGGDTGKSILTINGGTVKAAKLAFGMKNAKIVFESGTLMVKSENLSEEAMKKLIDEGRIDASNAKNWKISTKDEYTILESAAE
jgi:hypothetical protein